MSRYRFELATAADDAQLRAILAATPMDGEAAVAFQREPSFFDAAVVEGPFHQTIVGRDVDGGRIVGFGSRSVRQRYVNGTPAAVGYLSSLRVLPQYRNLGLVARGYAFFRRLHADGRTPFYLTTIAEGNERALAILTSGRAGLPRYHDAGLYHTAVIPAASRFRRRARAGLEVRAAEPADLPAIVAFLQRRGPARQFFPVYDPADFTETAATFRGLAMGDIALAFRAGRLAGVLAAWDQRSFRQTVVHGYRGRLRRLRPLYNILARLRGAPRLPRPGEMFPFLTAALPTVEEDDSAILAALIDRQTERLAATGGAYLLLGLHERDPLLPAVQARQVTAYVTRLYHVCWEDSEPQRAELDDRPPYLELGCL